MNEVNFVKHRFVLRHRCGGIVLMDAPNVTSVKQDYRN